MDKTDEALTVQSRIPAAYAELLADLQQFSSRQRPRRLAYLGQLGTLVLSGKMMTNVATFQDEADQDEAGATGNGRALPEAEAQSVRVVCRVPPAYQELYSGLQQFPERQRPRRLIYLSQMGLMALTGKLGMGGAAVTPPLRQPNHESPQILTNASSVFTKGQPVDELAERRDSATPGRNAPQEELLSVIGREAEGEHPPTQKASAAASADVTPPVRRMVGKALKVTR